VSAGAAGGGRPLLEPWATGTRRPSPPFWQAAPLAPAAIAWTLGVALSPAAALPASSLVSATGLALSAAALALRGRRHREATGLLLAAVALLGALRALPLPPPADDLAALGLPRRLVLEGRVAEEPRRWSAERQRVLVEATGVREGRTWRAATGLVQLTVHGEAPPLAEGTALAAPARLAPPAAYRNPGGFDYAAHLARDGIRAMAWARGEAIETLGEPAPPWPGRLRRWAIGLLGRHLPPGSAALLAGLLVGERARLPPEVDESFRAAGVYHILAVSGFNVALVAGAVFGGLRLLGLGRRGAGLGAAGALLAFALVAGAQPSVLRATVMGLAVLAAAVVDRESQLPNALALATLGLLLWRPGDLWEPGFQLSYAATAGIVLAAPPLEAGLRERGLPGPLAAALAVSAAAQLAVTPVMLAHFNQLSVIGVAANLVVVPLAAAATVLGLLGVALGALAEAPAGWLLNAVWPLLLTLRAAARLAAAVPGAMLHLPAPPAVAVAGWYAALLLLRRPAGGGRRLALLGLALLVLGPSLWPWLRPPDGRLRVLFVDVGQGDAALVELPGGERLLVDTGPGGPGRLDVAERVLAPVLWNRPVRRLAAVALSHADPDHAGGLPTVLRRFAVDELWEGARPGGGGLAVCPGLRQRRLAWPTRLRLGEVTLDVLHPDGVPLAGRNENSLVLRLQWRDVSILFAGDLGAPGEQRLLARGEPGPISVLKVGHHGSRFSSSAPFLAAARPQVAVIPVGARNPFGHPTPETLGRLARAGARVYRTDRDGAVLLETDGRTLWVRGWASGRADRLELGPRRAETPRPPATSPGASAGRAAERERLAVEGALVLGAQPLQLLRIETDAQGEPHLPQDRLDLVEGLLAEVLGLQQLRLGLLDQVGDRADVGGLQAVRGPHRQLQLVDVAEEVLVERHPGRGLAGRLGAVLLGRRGLREGREQGEVVLEDARGLPDRGLGIDGAVRPDLEHEPLLAPRQLLGLEVHAADGREVRVDQHGVDRQGLRLAPLGRLVAPPPLDAQLHLERAVLVQGGQDDLRREDVHVRVGLEVPGPDRPRPLRPEAQDLGAVDVDTEDHPPDVHDDVEGVLGHALHVGELVQDALHLDPRGRGPVDGRQQDPPVRVADRGGQARLEGLEPQLAVGRLAHEPLVTGRDDELRHGEAS
jgi:competence protein ComEC